jgi:hypothetical protein
LVNGVRISCSSINEVRIMGDLDFFFLDFLVCQEEDKEHIANFVHSIRKLGGEYLVISNSVISFFFPQLHYHQTLWYIVVENKGGE